MNHYSNNKRNSASRMCLKKMFLMFLVCGIFLQTMFPWLTVYGSDQSPSPQKLSAVPDGDVKDYEARFLPGSREPGSLFSKGTHY